LTDCNSNGVLDECDITSGTSLDCNQNGIPDECETDCNTNGVPDDCDITSGTSLDCNQNGVPDECDVAPGGGSEDCNANGIPDECETDCNSNGVPDDCDIRDANSLDCNSNGIPDECETDCNSNGVPDDCDIENKTSADNNGDGIPDECQSADLSVVKTADVDPANAGSPLKYSVVVKNLGPDVASNVVVVDTLPPTVAFVSATTTKGSVSHLAGTVTGNIGTMSASEVTTVTIFVNPLDAGVIVNVVTVTSDLSDPEPGNDTDTEITDVCPGFDIVIEDPFSNDPVTTPSSPLGWAPFAFKTFGFADQYYNAPNTALVGRITADATRFRVAGHVSKSAQWMPYAAVGSDKYVRAKFYVYATGNSDWTTTGAMPNVRLRLSHRFAQNSMLEVFNHLNEDPAASLVAQDIRPSTDPSNPSMYRVDLDLVDTPYLEASGTTEGVWCAYEAYSIDPQDQGEVGLTEYVLGTYPKSLLPDTVAPLKVYATSSSDAGDLKVVTPSTDLRILTLIPNSTDGVSGVHDPLAAPPTHTESALGITISTRDVAADRRGLAVREFDAGPLVQRVRVNEAKQYKVRFHVTSTQESRLQSQFRARARAVRFNWSQKFEIGGAWNSGTSSNIDAQQALPGIGCLNPDRYTTDTAGGWYTLLFHTPLSEDIRPEFEPGTPLSTRMPLLAAQPGPGVEAPSFRDLRVGFDVVDTISMSVLEGIEQGEFTLDRIEIREYDLVDDGPCELLEDAD
jgi:uncharacterized repeat protein (TIGR01451 family)